MHERLSAEYPAICSYAQPGAVEIDPARDPLEGVCLCLDFEAEGA